MKQRLEYIDQIKGFAIFLVVVGHVYIISFGYLALDESSLWNRLISSFHMPLFAFVSGLMMTGRFSWSRLRSKCERLLLPFFVVGIAYIYWRDLTVHDYFTNCVNYGYWYLKLLLLMWGMIVAMHYLSSAVSHTPRLVVDVPIALVVYASMHLMPKDSLAYLALSWDRMLWLFPYIFGGYCISRYKWFELLFSNVRLFSLLCAAAIVGWLTMTWLQHGRAVWLLCPSLVYVVVSLFYRGQVYPAIVTRTLGAWGRQSLEIYVLHVFLLHSTLIYIPKEYMGFKSGYIVLLANIVLSVVIVYSCLLFSSAIKRCSWLAYVCFGERSSKA